LLVVTIEIAWIIINKQAVPVYKLTITALYTFALCVYIMFVHCICGQEDRFFFVLHAQFLIYAVTATTVVVQQKPDACETSKKQ
jgi:hypothetical protein